MTRKYQQGGSAQDELNQFAQDIILNQLFGEDTEAKLLQLAKELPQVIQLLFLIWKQAGIEGVVKALQQALKAARGAKLNRVMALSNRCPQGYMKKGGKCKKCERGNKLDLTKGVFHINGYFKNGGRTVTSKAIGGMFTGLMISDMVKTGMEATGKAIESSNYAKAKQKELETLRDINNNNNNTAIAMAGARNDAIRSNLMYNADMAYRNARKPYTPYNGNNTYSYLKGTNEDGVKRKKDDNKNNNIIGYDNTVRGKGDNNELSEVTVTPSRIDNILLNALRTSPEMFKPMIRRTWQKALEAGKYWQDKRDLVHDIMPYPIPTTPIFR